MTRDQADRLVARGAARWLDADTLDVNPNRGLPMRDGTTEPATTSIVRLTSHAPR